MHKIIQYYQHFKLLNRCLNNNIVGLGILHILHESWPYPLDRFLGISKLANPPIILCADCVFGKVNLKKIVLINPFMNRFQNGLLIPRGHVTRQLMDQSEIDLRKFHSTFSRIIVFFRSSPKISLIRPRFCYYFFLSFRYVE